MGNIVDLITGIAIELGKKKYGQIKNKKSIQDSVNQYIEANQMRNFNIDKSEELDFQGLADYIKTSLIGDVELRLFGTRDERQRARDSIRNKAVAYAQAKTTISEKKAADFASGAVDIIREFYQSKQGKELRLLAAEVVDTVSDVVCENTNKVLDQTEKNHRECLNKITETSKMSIDNCVSLAQERNFPELENNLGQLMTYVSVEHPLFPDFGYERNSNTKKFYSTPLTDDACKKYPPSTKMIGKIKVDGKYLQSGDDADLENAIRTCKPIELNVEFAKKYLGDIEDPIQREAKELEGKSIILAPEFPSAFPASISLNNDILFEYILLRTCEIRDDGTVILDNREQDFCSYSVQFELNKSTRNLAFNIKLNEHTNEKRLEYLKLIKRLHSGGNLSVKVLSLNEHLCSGDFKNYDAKFDVGLLDSMIEVREKVLVVERFFKQSLTIPEELTEDEYNRLTRLATLASGEMYEVSWTRLNFAMNVTTETKEKFQTHELGLDDGKYGAVIKFLLELDLFGYNYELDVYRIFSSIKIEAVQRIKDKLEILDIGDVINVQCTPLEGEVGFLKELLSQDQSPDKLINGK